MSETSTADTPAVSDALKIQILATEHWSLLATRSMIWNEIFTRAGMFLTLLSASVVALALVAQATEFGREFRLFALLVLPVTLLLGIGTMIRIADAMAEDVWLVMGMNRLRHAYLDTAPDLEHYFITSQYDDEAGLAATIGPHPHTGMARMISATPSIVGIIDCVLTGVIVGLLAGTLDAPLGVMIGIGIVGALAAAAVLVVLFPIRKVQQLRSSLQPRFLTPHAPGGPVSSQQ